MRYVQLRAFHNVARHGGFSRAAQALNLTQPAISDQVRKLEAQYDILLFNRIKKKVTLTETGQNLLEITNRMFDSEHQALDLLNESRALSSGTLRIIATSANHLNTILSRFRHKYPQIKISLRAGNTEDIIAALYAYKADLGVIGEVPEIADIDVFHLVSSPIIAFARKGFAPKTLSLAGLARYPLVFRETGSKTRAKIEDLAHSLGIPLNPIIEAEGREAVHELVAHGAGIGFVSAAELAHDGRVEKINVTDMALTMDESLINLRERRGGKLIRAFADLAAQN